MGKNQQHKAMQQARHSATNAEGEAIPDAGDGTVDVSFHSPEWHAARIAALTTERMSWEDFKKKQKDEASLAAAEAENEDEAMRKYRTQLDADRAARLSKGTNNAHLAKSDSTKKRKRDKDKKRSKDKKRGKEKKGSNDKKRSKEKKSKKDSRKRRRSSSSDSEATDSSGSDSEAREPKRKSSPMRLSEFLAGK